MHIYLIFVCVPTSLPPSTLHLVSPQISLNFYLFNKPNPTKVTVYSEKQRERNFVLIHPRNQLIMSIVSSDKIKMYWTVGLLVQRKFK